MYRKLLRPALPLFHDLLHDLIPQLLLDLIDPLKDIRHGVRLVFRHELFAALLLLPGLPGMSFDIPAEHQLKDRPHRWLDEEQLSEVGKGEIEAHQLQPVRQKRPEVEAGISENAEIAADAPHVTLVYNANTL